MHAFKRKSQPDNTGLAQLLTFQDYGPMRSLQTDPTTTLQSSALTN
jgi:hypothetical protein